MRKKVNYLSFPFFIAADSQVQDYYPDRLPAPPAYACSLMSENLKHDTSASTLNPPLLSAY
jgi:hypothetical protein